MTSNNLPRLENSAFNRNAFIGGAQVIFGVTSFLGALITLLVQGFIKIGTNTTITGFSVIMWLAIFVGVWFISAGSNRFEVNSTFRKLHGRLTGGEFTIEKLAELLGTSVPRLLKDIALMNTRKYWKNVTVLDDAIVITPINGGDSYKIFAKEGMRFTTAEKGIAIPQPAVIAFLIGLVFLIKLPFLKIIWIVVAVILSFPVQRLTRLFMPKQTYINYSETPKYIPETIELTLSGDEQADQLIAKAEKYLQQLQDLERKIDQPHLLEKIREISAGTKQMVDKLRESPEKHRQVRQTMEYSLPTAINLFYKYVELDAQPVKGENIKRSMDKIVEMSDLVSSTFKRELDYMYQDQTLDIEVDIEVMRTLLKNEEMDLNSLTSEIDNNPTSTDTPQD